MAGKVLKMNNMHKINNSTIMNRSAENPATTHTRDRYHRLKENDRAKSSEQLTKKYVETLMVKYDR